MSELINFYSPWNHQKTIGFLKNSGGIKVNSFPWTDSILKAKFHLEWQDVYSSLKSRIDRSSRPEVFFKKVLLKFSQNSQENTCARVSFLIKLQASACNFLKKEALAQVFSCEFWEIFKNTYSYRTPLMAASEHTSSQQHL